MPVVYSDVRDALRLWTKDLGTPYNLSDARWLPIINRGYRRLATWLFHEKTAGLITDGVRRSFDLSGSAADDVAADYLGFKRLHVLNIGELEVEDAGQIDSDAEAGRLATSTSVFGLEAGYPFKAGLRANQLVFDAAPAAATEVITNTDDRLFTGGAGNWSALAGATIAESSDRLQITAAAPVSTDLAELDEYTLVPEREYVLSFQIAKGTWAVGDVLVTVGDAQTFSKTIAQAALTTALTTYILKFRAREASGKITISCSAEPTTGNTLLFDNFSLKLAQVAVTYYGTPDDFSADSDIPAFPLNIFDQPLIEAAKWAYALSTDNKPAQANAEAALNALRPEFMRLATRKGKLQRRNTTATRL